MKYIYLISTAAFCMTYLAHGCHSPANKPHVRLVTHEEEQRTDISTMEDEKSNRRLEEEAECYAQELEAQEAPYTNLYEISKKHRGLRRSENHRAIQRALRQSYHRKTKRFEEAFETAYHSDIVLNIVSDCAQRIMSATNAELQKKFVSKDFVPRNVTLNLTYTLGITYLLSNGTSKKIVWKTNT